MVHLTILEAVGAWARPDEGTHEKGCQGVAVAVNYTTRSLITT
jgi:hypothetical protein